MTLSDFQSKIGYKFKKVSLLEEALLHSSVGLGKNYERLEFLGDSVLSLIIKHEVFCIHKDKGEGYLSKVSNSVVKAATIMKVVDRLGFKELVNIKDIDLNFSNSILVDICEAIIGAIFIDGGFVAAKEVIKRYWGEFLTREYREIFDNPKSFIQEWCQKNGLSFEYKTVSVTGEDHNPLFEIMLVIDGFSPIVTKGRKKRLAETEAARIFLERNVDQKRDWN